MLLNFFALITVAGCDLVESQTYSTGDVLLSSETVFIVELELKCTGTEVSVQRHLWG